MKKKIAVVLIVILLLATITACGTGTTTTTSSASTGGSSTEATTTQSTTAQDENWFNQEGLPIVNEIVSYSLLAPRTATQGEWDKMWVFKEIESRTGIRIIPETVDSSGWEERKSLRFATGDLPDFFMNGLSQFDVINYGTQGALITLSDLLDKYAPNVKEFFTLADTVEKSITAPDGNIYMLPAIDLTPREKNLSRFYINVKWAENLDIAIPKTVDDFFDLAMAIKNEDANQNGDKNDEIPIGGRFRANGVEIPLLAPFGYIDSRIDVIDDKVLFVPIQDNYKPYLEYMHKLFSEGLIDPEYFTQANDQFTAKGSKGLYGAFVYAADWVMMSDEALYSQYSMIPPMTSEYNTQQIWPARDVNTWGGYAIVNHCEKPEALIRLIDYLFTLEGRMMVRVGPEAGTWDGEGGFVWTTNDQGEKCFDFVVPEGYASFNAFREAVILPMAIPFGDDGTMGAYFTGKDPRQVRLTRHVLDNLEPYYKAGYPYLYFTQEENDEINMLKNDIYSYVEQMEAKFIIGDEPLSNWDDFVSSVKNMQLDKLVNIHQDAYDRWNR